jgi:hypothetical protein
MKRRKFVVGTAMTTAGLSTLSASGAFSSAEISREATIPIVNDSNALLGLVPNPDVAGVHDDDGKLTIDLADPGINQSSIFQFGLFADGSDGDFGDLGGFPFTSPAPSNRDSSGSFDSAFLIANQTDNQQTLEIDYQLTNNAPGVDFWFEIHDGGSRLGNLIKAAVDTSKTITIGSGDAIGVSFLLDVDEDTIGEEITGSLSIEAGKAVD